MFPKLTFLDRTFYVCSREDLGYDWNPYWTHKYKKWGFDVDLKFSDTDMKLGLRTVKDSHCWVIPFPGERQYSFRKDCCLTSARL